MSLLPEKLESLHKYLSDDLMQLNPGLELDNENSQLTDFAQQLFKKSPEDFLKKSSTEEMAEIVAKSHRLYNEYASSNDKFRIEITNHISDDEKPGYTSVTCCLKDRAFVIDSLLEYWRRNDIDHYVSLYPILKSKDGSRIALVYMQIELVNENHRIKKIESELSGILNELILATDDFPQMLVQAETAARLLEIGIGFYDQKNSQRSEVAEFLRWLASDGFIFLGYREWLGSSHDAGQNQSVILSLNESSDLGLFKSTNLELQDYLIDIQKDAEFLINSGELVYSATVQACSSVHRYSPLTLFHVKVPQKDGSSLKIVTFLGLYTSIFESREVKSVPIIRKKLDYILEAEEVLPNSHDHKEIVSILGSIPKSQVLRQPVDVLYKNVKMILGMQRRREARIAIYSEPNERHFSILVVIPKKKYSGGVRSKILRFLADYFSASTESIELSTSTSAEPLTVLHYHVPNMHVRSQLSTEELEAKIIDLTNTWDDKLHIELVQKYGKATGKFLAQFYQDTLPEDYKAGVEIETSLLDIDYIEKLREGNLLLISINEEPDSSESHIYNLNLYKLGLQFTLSNILPFLENIGFHVLSETETVLQKNNDVWVTIYRLKVKTDSALDLKNSPVIIPALQEILSRDAENDSLNALLLNPGLNNKEIAILRVLSKYLWQIKVFAAEKIISDTLINNPELSLALCKYFDTKFNPDLEFNDTSEREQELKKLKKSFIFKLKKVHNLLHDRVLRAMINIIDATLRTNAYQDKKSFTISIKLNCKIITEMPVPRPMFEIFVNGLDVSGVHHRGGKVARGGIRWSDRTEDFRTEVLGLSKTQIVKNSIIIPTGAKGGFIVKKPSRDNLELRENVEICYKTFIRSLLQITDNRKKGQIIRPANTICYDDIDPYLVVAADKGTATFSDIANEIAKSEFDFWLGDAFASGGSNGYDHKKLSITASGAWVAACRHFRELGHDVDKSEFTVVGIGDMSGDVFGNGLLQNDNAKLIAAFNHKHIFVDPDPDPKESFKERQRMFELPHSNWTDYDEDKISKGGGIYERSSKEIKLSPEAKKALGTNEDVVSGQELIKIILLSPTDLLWNGGIGTYVKSHKEEDVGDPSNDDVRVDARELRVKIVAEGGNLGFTQEARIEYTRIGGRINTDAVDNSGGVDLSDLEVNLKILLRAPVVRGELSEEERNKILDSHAKSACDKVLRRNRSQTKAISLGLTRSQANLDYYRGLMNNLEKDGLLNRAAENLPSDLELKERIEAKTGLTRPELAVVIGYVKMWLTNIIIDSDLPEKQHLRNFLFNYFPEDLVQRFQSDVENHPLRREIIATQLANKIVERMGASFVFRCATETGKNEREIILAFLIAGSLVGARQISEELDELDTASATREFHSSHQILTSTLDQMTKWILSLNTENLEIDEVLLKYSEAVNKSLEKMSSILGALEQNRLQESISKLTTKGFRQELAEKICSLPYFVNFLGALQISIETNKDIVSVSKLYSNLLNTLFIDQLLVQAKEIKANDKWEQLSIKNSLVEIKNSVTIIAHKIIMRSDSASIKAMDKYLNNCPELIEQLKSSMKESGSRSMTPAALAVISGQLRALSNR